MKKTILILICCLVALSSCKKSGINAFRGDYTFKSSGEVFLQREPSGESNIIPATFNYTLPNEIGQLEIRTLDSKENTVVVVMNYMNDEVIVTQGTCKGQEIVLEEFQRNALKVSMYSYISTSCIVNVNATGHIYDDSTIVLDMVYDGTATIANLNYHIRGNSIQMVATRN